MDSTIFTIPVHTRSSYEVQIGSGLLNHCGMILRDVLPVHHIAIISDTMVARLYLDRVKNSLLEAGFAVSSYVFSAGEKNKNFSTFSNILEYLAMEHLTRTDGIVALGGGVTGDMAGFSAAVYMRGIQYVQLPTTLLSAVDSSVGGKTAIDLKVGKNLIGAFIQPTAVLCDTECLCTLPSNVFADGVAEAVKTGVLSGEELFSLLEAGISPTIESVDIADIIARCVTYKATVVERDELERNERRLLNLGHTVGHAIEKCSNYEIPHGHAVAAGLGIITKAAERLGWTVEPLSERVNQCLERNCLPYSTDIPAEALAKAALSDKKRSGDKITLVIPEQIGHCILKTISVTELLPIIHLALDK